MGASGILYVVNGLGTILEDLKIISYSPSHISHIIYLTGPHGNFEKLRLGMQNNNRGIISSSLLDNEGIDEATKVTLHMLLLYFDRMES